MGAGRGLGRAKRLDLSVFYENIFYEDKKNLISTCIFRLAVL